MPRTDLGKKVVAQAALLWLAAIFAEGPCSHYGCVVMADMGGYFYGEPDKTEPGAPCPGAKVLKGDALEIDYDSCPNLDTLSELSQVEADIYDPTLVDWRSVKKAIEFLANKEPRFCNFAIRAHFHDAGAIGTVDEAPNVRGSDGSLMLDKFEFLQPENAYDAFSIFVRVVLKELARFYGASFADLQNLAAFTCVEALGATVTIPEACETAGIDLEVGKLDAAFDFSTEFARERVDNLPGPFQETPIWINFWLNILNDVAEGEKWKFTIEDALALMGSHTLIDNQACTTNGPALTEFDQGNLLDEQCNGEKRVFDWTNSYFVDATSGVCDPREFRPGTAEWFVTSMENSKGRQPNDEEDAQLEFCPWKSDDGRLMGKNLECIVVTGAADLGIGEIPEDNDFRFVDWFPDDNRAPCCGYHCQTCPGDLDDEGEPYYCANDSPKGTSFWFYTWADCDMIFSARNPDNFCERPYIDCTRYEGDDLTTQVKRMAEAYGEFAGSTEEWQTKYAYGHCKFNNLAARWSPKRAKLLPMLDDCKGTIIDGVCTTDPDEYGFVASPLPDESCCVGVCDGTVLQLEEIISEKQCNECDDEELEPIEVPEEDGEELEPGQEIVKGDLVTTVADIQGEGGGEDEEEEEEEEVEEENVPEEVAEIEDATS